MYIKLNCLNINRLYKFKFIKKGFNIVIINTKYILQYINILNFYINRLILRNILNKLTYYYFSFLIIIILTKML